MADHPVRLDDLIAYVKSQRSEADPVGHLSDAMLLAEHMGEQADHLIGHFVDQARRSGASWSEIGTAMGVSKQAAQKRFVGRADDRRPNQDLTAAASGMFARFTPRARKVMVASEDEARAAGHTAIAPEHLLLALLTEPAAIAGRALQHAGVSAEAVRAAVAVLPPGEPGGPARIPFSDGAKAAIEFTLAEALRLGHNYIGTEHLLLGLYVQPPSGAVQVLDSLGLDRDALEAWMLAEVGKVAAGPAT
jgi:hypothetical protein